LLLPGNIAAFLGLPPNFLLNNYPSPLLFLRFRVIALCPDLCLSLVIFLHLPLSHHRRRWAVNGEDEAGFLGVENGG